VGRVLPHLPSSPPSCSIRVAEGGGERSRGDPAPVSVADAAFTNQITPLPQRGRGAGGEGLPQRGRETGGEGSPLTFPPAPLPRPRCGRGRGEGAPAPTPRPPSARIREEKGEVSGAGAILSRSPLSRSAGEGLGVRASRSVWRGRPRLRRVLLRQTWVLLLSLQDTG